MPSQIEIIFDHNLDKRGILFRLSIKHFETYYDYESFVTQQK